MIERPKTTGEAFEQLEAGGFSSEQALTGDIWMQLEEHPAYVFLKDLFCPTPEMAGLYPVVCFFKDRSDAKEFEAAILMVKPDMQAKHLK